MGDKDDIEVTASPSVVCFSVPPHRARLTVCATMPAVYASAFSHGQHVTRHDFIRTDYTGATEINLVIYPPHRPRELTLHPPMHFSIRSFTNKFVGITTWHSSPATSGLGSFTQATVEAGRAYKSRQCGKPSAPSSPPHRPQYSSAKFC